MGNSFNGIGVLGTADGSTAVNYGVKGSTSSTSNGASGVYGVANGTSGVIYGVQGQTNSTSGDTAGVYGTANIGSGVYGFGTSGYGVRGETSGGGAGVYGQSSITGGKGGGLSSGVLGNNTAGGNGVAGGSFSGPGVYGRSLTGYGIVASGGTAPLYLEPSTSVGIPTTGNHAAGEFYKDKNGELYYCSVSGSPGTWVKLNNGYIAGANIILTPNADGTTTIACTATGGTPSGGTTFLATPIRIALVLSGDSGALTSDPSGSPTASTTSDIQVTGIVDPVSKLNVPAGAKAIIGALTSVGATSSGNLRLWPSGGPVPNVNTLNIPAKPDGTGFNLTTSVTVGLSTNGKVSIAFSGRTGAKCGFALDVAGYIM